MLQGNSHQAKHVDLLVYNIPKFMSATEHYVFVDGSTTHIGWVSQSVNLPVSDHYDCSDYMLPD